MPIVDIKTGKITGCKKNSFAWWHEKGHLVYNSTEDNAQRNYRGEISIVISIYFCCLGLMFSFGGRWIEMIFGFIALFCIVHWIYTTIREENFANDYASKHFFIHKTYK